MFCYSPIAYHSNMCEYGAAAHFSFADSSRILLFVDDKQGHFDLNNLCSCRDTQLTTNLPRTSPLSYNMYLHPIRRQMHCTRANIEHQNSTSSKPSIGKTVSSDSDIDCGDGTESWRSCYLISPARNNSMKQTRSHSSLYSKRCVVGGEGLPSPQFTLVQSNQSSDRQVLKSIQSVSKTRFPKLQIQEYRASRVSFCRPAKIYIKKLLFSAALSLSDPRR